MATDLLIHRLRWAPLDDTQDDNSLSIRCCVWSSIKLRISSLHLHYSRWCGRAANTLWAALVLDRNSWNEGCKLNSILSLFDSVLEYFTFYPPLPPNIPQSFDGFPPQNRKPTEKHIMVTLVAYNAKIPSNIWKLRRAEGENLINFSLEKGTKLICWWKGGENELEE